MKARFVWMVELESGKLVQHKDRLECVIQAAWSGGVVKRVKLLYG